MVRPPAQRAQRAHARIHVSTRPNQAPLLSRLSPPQLLSGAPQVCPMRFVLVFVSALLAAAAACISFRTPAPSLADPPPLPTKVSLAHRRRRRITLHQLAIALTCASPRLHLPASPPRELGYLGTHSYLRRSSRTGVAAACNRPHGSSVLNSVGG
jgi:hypothetical protein